MQYILIAIVFMSLCLFGFSCRNRPFGPIGAMCYKVAVTPVRTDYVCPTCGEKTLYAFDDTVDDPNAFQRTLLANELESCRRAVQKINGFDIELDESQFCKVCSPDIESPQLGLVVRHPDKPEPHRVWGVSEIDLTIIKAYADGRIKKEGMADVCIARLEELLGVKLEESPEDLKQQ